MQALVGAGQTEVAIVGAAEVVGAEARAADARATPSAPPATTSCAVARSSGGSPAAGGGATATAGVVRRRRDAPASTSTIASKPASPCCAEPGESFVDHLEVKAVAPRPRRRRHRRVHPDRRAGRDVVRQRGANAVVDGQWPRRGVAPVVAERRRGFEPVAGHGRTPLLRTSTSKRVSRPGRSARRHRVRPA